MATILPNNNFKCISFKLNENDGIPILISPKFVPTSAINNKPVLVQVMAWCRTGNKPLPEPMLTQFTDAYMGHKGEMSLSLGRCGYGFKCVNFSNKLGD